MTRRAAAAFILVLLAGPVVSSCSRHTVSQSGNARTNVITREDIERVHARSALDAVQRYRSDVLVRKAPSSVLLDKRPYPVVFLNDQELGQIDELRNVPADEVEEIRIHTGPEATTKWGSRFGGGVIQIISRSGGEVEPTEAAAS